MSLLSGVRTRPHRMVVQGICLMASLWLVNFVLPTGHADAQEVVAETATDPPAKVEPVADKPTAAANPFMTAADLLPDGTAGFARIPSMPVFCETWRQMHIGKLIDDPAMKDFVDAQKARAENYFESIDNKIGMRPEDLFEIASGEVSVAWLPFKNDQRRPYSVCLIADVRGNDAKTEAVVAQIDKDLIEGGGKRKDVKYRGQVIRVYETTPKPGQIKVEQIALTFNDSRLIASDRDSVIQDLLDAIAGMPKGAALSRNADYKQILSKSDADVQKLANDNLARCVEWYAKPFEMGRILREVFEVDRGNDVDVLKLLEGQGFSSIRALGGIAVANGEKYDLVHRGRILATRPFQKAAKMLDFFSAPYKPIPAWVDQEAASFTRVNWRMEKAFWASETLINEALGDEIFRDMLKGIRDDEEGPQIDVAKNFLPHLDDQAILITDNTQPTVPDSERMLVAIQLKNAAAVRNVIRKAMEVEPDASELKALPGVEIWQVEQGESEEDFDLASELGFEEEEEGAGGKPLLDHWAIAVVDKGPGSTVPYLMFSSHPQLLIKSAKRIQNGGNKADALAQAETIKEVVAATKALGGNTFAMDRVVQLKLAIRAKYELLRKGQLKDSDSVLSTVFRRLVKEDEGGQPDPLNAKKLPALKQIEKHFPDGGAFVVETPEGWSMTGFFLK